MALPEVTVTIQDGALGIVPANVNGQQALIGVSSSGTANTVYQFGDLQVLKTTLGSGPLVEAAAKVLNDAGGPVLCVRTGSSAGTVSAVTQSGTGLSVLTTTGSVAVDAYEVIVAIVVGAANPAAGLATIKWSLDGGQTYSAETQLPVSGIYAIVGAGVTLNFSAASLVALDTYSFSTVAPAYSVGQFGTAFDALLADPTEWFLVHAVGVPADGAAAAALFASLDAKLTTAESQFRYARGLMQAQDDTDANIKTTFISLVSTRVVVAAGFCRLTSPISLAQYKRPASFVVGARASAVDPSEDLGKVATGACPGVTYLYRDESLTPGLDVARFTTLRTLVGQSGFFITQGKLFALTTSDYQLLQYGRVMDIASRGARQGGLHFLNDDLFVDKTTGFLDAVEANDIDNYISSVISALIIQPGFATSLTVAVSRTEPILSTQRMPIVVRVIPKGYSKFIDINIGLRNPAVQA